jgi:hypothetical protein
VCFSSVARPPYSLGDAQLEATDPRPWAEAPPNATADELVERRRNTARTMTRAIRTGQSLGARRHGEVFRWIAEAAAADADRIVAQVVEVLDATRSWPRTHLVVASTFGTAVGDRGVVGAASGVDLGQAAVPLVWHLPGASRASRSSFPAQLSDVASTLVDAVVEGPAAGQGLLGEAPADRERLAIAWYERAGTPRAQVRLTRASLTLLVDSEGQTKLFDRRWDPLEFEDLTPHEPHLAARQRQALARRLWGDAPQLWILVKGDATDITSGVVRGRDLGTAQAVGLEDLDAIESRPDHLSFSFVGDTADVVKIPLPTVFADVVVEIQSPRAKSPWFLGTSARPWADRAVPLGSFQPAALAAWAGDDPPDPVSWLADRPAGVTVWLVGG